VRLPIIGVGKIELEVSHCHTANVIKNPRLSEVGGRKENKQHYDSANILTFFVFGYFRFHFVKFMTNSIFQGGNTLEVFVSFDTDFFGFLL